MDDIVLLLWLCVTFLEFFFYGYIFQVARRSMSRYFLCVFFFRLKTKTSQLLLLLRLSFPLILRQQRVCVCSSCFVCGLQLFLSAVVVFIYCFFSPLLYSASVLFTFGFYLLLFVAAMYVQHDIAAAKSKQSANGYFTYMFMYDVIMGLGCCACFFFYMRSSIFV